MYNIQSNPFEDIVVPRRLRLSNKNFKRNFNYIS